MNKNEQWISVRIHTPLGLYPPSSLLLDEAALYVDEEIIYSAVKCNNFHIDDENYYSEVEWANQQEIKFFSSINLARIRDYGLCFLYPFRYPQDIEIKYSTPLNNLDLLKDIKKENKDPLEEFTKESSKFEELEFVRKVNKERLL